MIRLKLTTIALIGSALLLVGQSYEYNGDPDLSFERARELAFNQERERARDTLLVLLNKYPNYDDIRAFLGSTYSWDGEYDKAREAFTYVLKRNPDRKETWQASINNELWDEKVLVALDMANRALQYFPNDQDLLYQKASAQIYGQNPAEAFGTLQLIKDQDPDNEKAINFENYLANKLSLNTIGLSSSLDLYSVVFDPMQYYAFKYGRQTKFGSVLGRVNVNRRFQTTGSQFEVDMYPRIIKGLYAYVNLGVSNSFIFPDFRYSAELFKSLPNSLEVSLGFRALKYSSGTTMIYTGSVGWYTGNNYLYVRSYMIPNDAGFSKSGSFNFRKYRSDAYNYSSISIGMGFSPLTSRFEYDGLDVEIINLKSQSFGLGHYFTTGAKKYAWGISGGITHQEISFDPGHYFWIYSLSFSWDLKFR
ncbi:MAG: YaiO family outer membrane beta-barrel protein [Saprospiraceae bacterium]|nr:YaiO family outer membrane beta-barrel protein [Saprospiraceae bacterium]